MKTKNLSTAIFCLLIGMGIGIRSGGAAVKESQANKNWLVAQNNTQVVQGNYITVENEINYYVDVFIDDIYSGTIGPKGMLKSLKAPGDYSVRVMVGGCKKTYSNVKLSADQETIIVFNCN